MRRESDCRSWSTHLSAVWDGHAEGDGESKDSVPLLSGPHTGFCVDLACMGGLLEGNRLFEQETLVAVRQGRCLLN